MTYLVIRARSDRGVTKKIRDTMAMLNLTRVNHAVLLPETPSYAGMLQKAKDFVTWGEVDAETISTLLKERGRMTGDKPVTDTVVKSGSEYSTVDALAKAIASGDATQSISGRGWQTNASRFAGSQVQFMPRVVLVPSSQQSAAPPSWTMVLSEPNAI